MRLARIAGERPLGRWIPQVVQRDGTVEGTGLKTRSLPGWTPQKGIPHDGTGFDVRTLEPDRNHARGGLTAAYVSQLSEPPLDDDAVGTNRTGMPFEFFDDVTLTKAPAQ